MILALEKAAPPAKTTIGRVASGSGRVWRRWRDYIPFLPALIVGLLVIFVALLLWFVDRDEREEQRLALIKNALWVEQALRFHLTTIEDYVERLAIDLGRSGAENETFTARAEHLVRTEPAIYRVVRRDEQGTMLAIVPPADLTKHNDVSPSRDDEDAVSLARLTGRRAYSMIHTTHNGGRAFDIVVPIFTGDRFSGSVTVTIALTAMLADAVPWWIAEQHRISFVNSAGTTLASKSRVETEEAEADYTLAFDPPGHGLYLAIAPYRTKTSLVHNSLVVAIVVLALLSCASLLVAYRHMRGRIRAEEMTRRHSEKLARNARLITMGELASTLAHELNQPLSAIESYATGCLNKLDSGDYTANEMRAALDKLSVQARRAGQVVHHVHEFVSRREPKIGVVDVAALLRDTLAFIAPAARRYDVTLQSEIADDLPNVKADQILLEQVLLNLIRNGFEAMVETPPEDRVLTVSVMRREGGIEIAVADRGCGITPEIAERMFMPFVSTKPEGMGMGLNICRSIIESHRGRLWTTPRPGGGTVFAFTLG